MALTRITKGVIKPNENYDTHNINSTGIVTAIGFKGPFTGSSDIQSGILTATKIDLNGDIDVDGHTNLDNVSIAGVTTATGAIDLNADLDVDGHTNLDNVNVAGVATFTGNVTIGGTLTYEDVTNIDSVGIVTARSQLNVGSNIKLGNAGVITATTFKGDGDFVDIDVDGHTNLDNVNIAGVTTFSGALDINAGVNISGLGDFAASTFNNIRLAYSGDSEIDTSSGNLILDSAGGTVEVTDNLTVWGAISANGSIDLNADIDVDGHTNLDNVSIAGVSTFTDNVTIVKTAGPLLELTTNTGAADATLRLSEGATGSTTNGGGMFYSGADNKLYITCGTNSTTKRITIQRDDGKVGINQTTPEEILDLGESNKQNLKFGQRGYLGQAHSTTATILGHCVKADTTNSVASQMMVTETNSGGGAPAAIRMVSGTIQFHTAGSGTANAVFDSEKLRITSVGNVDINGTPPWSVSGGNFRNLSISGEGVSGSGFLWLGNGAATTNADFHLGRISFMNGATRTSLIAGSTDTSANDDGRLEFYTKATGATEVERLRITSDGKYYFTGTGGGSGSRGLEIDTESVGAADEGVILNARASGTTGRIKFQTNSVTAMTILGNGGNISVGSNGAAAEKFQVNGGNIAIVGGSSYKIDTHPLISYASFTDISGGSYAARLGSTGTSTIRSTQIYGGGGHIATFDGVNKRLGINETSPDNKIHATTTSSTAYSSNTSNTQNITNALLKLQNLDGTDNSGVNNYVGIQFSVANGANSTAQLNYVRTGNNAGAFQFKARNAASTYPNLMTIQSNGRVGINQLNPQARLDSSGAYNEIGIRCSGGASGYSSAFVFQHANGDTVLEGNNARHVIPGADAVQDLGISTKRWRNVYTTDLQLSNVGGGGNEVDGTEGTWTLQEGEDDLYMINRKTGKKYKMMLQEIS